MNKRLTPNDFVKVRANSCKGCFFNTQRTDCLGDYGSSSNYYRELANRVIEKLGDCAFSIFKRKK